MTGIYFNISLHIKFDDVPEEIVTAFTEEPNKRKAIDGQVENIIETFLRDYYKSFFDGTTHDDVVKDLFTKTSGADPTAVIEVCEEV